MFGRKRTTKGSEARDQVLERAVEETSFWKAQLDKAVEEKNIWFERYLRIEHENEVLSGELFLARQEVAALQERLEDVMQPIGHSFSRTFSVSEGGTARESLSLPPPPAAFGGTVRVSEGDTAHAPLPLPPPTAFGGFSSTDLLAPPHRKSITACTSLGMPPEQERICRQSLQNPMGNVEQQLANALSLLKHSDVQTALLQERLDMMHEKIDRLTCDKAGLATAATENERKAEALHNNLINQQTIQDDTADVASRMLGELSRQHEANARLRAESQLKDEMIQLLKQEVLECSSMRTPHPSMTGPHSGISGVGHAEETEWTSYSDRQQLIAAAMQRMSGTRSQRWTFESPTASPCRTAPAGCEVASASGRDTAFLLEDGHGAVDLGRFASHDIELDDAFDADGAGSAAGGDGGSEVAHAFDVEGQEADGGQQDADDDWQRVEPPQSASCAASGAGRGGTAPTWAALAPTMRGAALEESQVEGPSSFSNMPSSTPAACSGVDTESEAAAPQAQQPLTDAPPAAAPLATTAIVTDAASASGTSSAVPSASASQPAGQQVQGVLPTQSQDAAASMLPAPPVAAEEPSQAEADDSQLAKSSHKSSVTADVVPLPPSLPEAPVTSSPISGTLSEQLEASLAIGLPAPRAAEEPPALDVLPAAAIATELPAAAAPAAVEADAAGTSTRLAPEAEPVGPAATAAAAATSAIVAAAAVHPLSPALLACSTAASPTSDAEPIAAFAPTADVGQVKDTDVKATSSSAQEAAGGITAPPVADAQGVSGVPVRDPGVDARQQPLVANAGPFGGVSRDANGGTAVVSGEGLVSIAASKRSSTDPTPVSAADVKTGTAVMAVVDQEGRAHDLRSQLKTARAAGDARAKGVFPSAALSQALDVIAEITELRQVPAPQGTAQPGSPADRLAKQAFGKSASQPEQTEALVPPVLGELVPSSKAGNSSAEVAVPLANASAAQTLCATQPASTSPQDATSAKAAAASSAVCSTTPSASSKESAAPAAILPAAAPPAAPAAAAVPAADSTGPATQVPAAAEGEAPATPPRPYPDVSPPSVAPEPAPPIDSKVRQEANAPAAPTPTASPRKPSVTSRWGHSDSSGADGGGTSCPPVDFRGMGSQHSSSSSLASSSSVPSQSNGGIRRGSIDALRQRFNQPAVAAGGGSFIGSATAGQGAADAATAVASRPPAVPAAASRTGSFAATSRAAEAAVAGGPRDTGAADGASKPPPRRVSSKLAAIRAQLENS